MSIYINRWVNSSRFVYVIAWARGQLRINFTRIFKVFAKLPESRSDEGNLENFENASEINPYLRRLTNVVHCPRIPTSNPVNNLGISYQPYEHTNSKFFEDSSRVRHSAIFPCDEVIHWRLECPRVFPL